MINAWASGRDKTAPACLCLGGGKQSFFHSLCPRRKTSIFKKTPSLGNVASNSPSSSLAPGAAAAVAAAAAAEARGASLGARLRSIKLSAELDAAVAETSFAATGATTAAAAAATAAGPPRPTALPPAPPREHPQNNSSGGGTSNPNSNPLLDSQSAVPSGQGQPCPPHGAKAICGRRPRMEDAYTAVPFLLEVPLRRGAGLW